LAGPVLSRLVLSWLGLAWLDVAWLGLAGVGWSCLVLSCLCLAWVSFGSHMSCTLDRFHSGSTWVSLGFHLVVVSAV
jgi:hypothetical protein